MDRDNAQIIKSYWHLVCEELDKLIEGERNALEACNDLDLDKHQERIKIYRQLKSLPDDVIARY